MVTSIALVMFVDLADPANVAETVWGVELHAVLRRLRQKSGRQDLVESRREFFGDSGGLDAISSHPVTS